MDLDFQINSASNWLQTPKEHSISIMNTEDLAQLIHNMYIALNFSNPSTLQCTL